MEMNKRPRGRPKKPGGAKTPAQRQQASRDRMKALNESLAGKGYVTIPLIVQKDRAEAIAGLANEIGVPVAALLGKAADVMLTNYLARYYWAGPERRSSLLPTEGGAFMPVELTVQELEEKFQRDNES